jgi:hypothetical protein
MVAKVSSLPDIAQPAGSRPAHVEKALPLSPPGRIIHPVVCTQELPGDVTMNLLVKILVMIGSSTSIGFGIWHFFVPKAWKWYSYIDGNATELVAAVRAINAFFSLSLVLFGIVNILLIYGGRSNRYSIIVMLAATCVLWLTRVSFQVIYPQGSLYPGLQYGMLSAFVIVTLCYLTIPSPKLGG